MNRQLKVIAKMCGIERRIVFHAGRHTYATEITLSHGVPLETVSKMLGHAEITTTQIYAKVPLKGRQFFLVCFTHRVL